MKRYIFLSVFLLITFGKAYSQSEEKFVSNSQGNSTQVNSFEVITSFGESIVGDDAQCSAGFLYAFDTLYLTSVASDNSQIINTIICYPNPAHDFIYLKSNETISAVFLNDLNGNILLSQSVFLNTFQLSLATFSRGVYFLTVKSEAAENIFKIIVQ